MGESHIKNTSECNDFAGAEHLADKSHISQQLTTFADDANLGSDDQFNKVPIPNPYPTETIKEWLCRPYPIRHVKWTQNVGVGDLLTSAVFPQDLFAIQQLWDKVSNFHYFRGNVKISIRMNGTKTHYGKIIAMWSPYPRFDPEYFDRTSNVYAVSGFPHIIVSPTENEVNELTIPFISPLNYSYLDPSSYTGGSYQKENFGGLYVYVLNTLQNMTGANTAVSFTVFANFEDVELAGYTVLKNPKPNSSPLPNVTKTVSPVANSLRAQAKRLRLPTPTKEAQAKSSKGIVGSTLEQVGNVAAKLTSIPILNSVASVVSPIAYSLGTIANLFGWTKPDTLEAIKPCVIRYIDSAQTHGLDTATKLALLPDNSVGSGIGYMGASPRMDFDSICATPMLIGIYLWDTSVAEGENLFQYPVSPSVVFSEFVDGRLRSYPTYLSHIARAFKYWRGDLRYYIQITSSAFHSGRLRVWYEPNDTTNPNNVIDGGNVVSKVLDIQTETDMSFTVPYLSNTLYRTFEYENPSRGGGSTTSPIGEAGRIGMSVLNELTSSSNPVQPVYINVWISGTNMQFGAPVGVSFDREPIEADNFGFVAQGITQEQIMKMPYEPLIEATTSREEQLCMGEQADHVKDLIMRPCPLIYYNTVEENPEQGEIISRYAYVEESDFPVSGVINGGGLPPGTYRYRFWGSSPQDGKVDFRLNTTTGIIGSTYVTSMNTLHQAGIERPVVEGIVVTDQHFTHFTVYFGGATNNVFYNAYFTSLETGAIPSNKPGSVATPPLNPVEGGKDIRIRVTNPFQTSYEVPTIPYLMRRPTYLSYFASIYRFWRGSVRYKLFEVRGSNTSTKVAHLDHFPPVGDFSVVSYDLQTSFTRGFAEGLASVREPVSNTLEITVPYYYNTSCRIHTSEPFFPDPITPIFDIIQNDRSVDLKAEGYILASAGDDFEFGFLVPPPFLNGPINEEP